MALDYSKYRVPQCKVIVENSELKSSAYNIEQVNVQLSADTKSNSADVTIVAKYDVERSLIGGELLSKLSAGKKVKIEMGYMLTSVVFLGYVNTVETSFSEGGVTVTFSCLDARGLLMGNSTWETYKTENVQQIVTKMLNSLSSYTDSITVQVEGEVDKEQPESQNELDDFKYLCYLAKITNSSFYMTATDLKFVKNGFEKFSVVEKYKWGEDIISFNRKVELSEQVGTVKVTGISPDTAEEFEATVKASANDGKTAGQLNSAVGKKELTVNSLTVKNQQEALAYARAIMFESAMKLSTGTAQVLGNEKLVVGKGVSFGGLDPNINGNYLITSLNHSFGPGGFLTTIGFASSGA